MRDREETGRLGIRHGLEQAQERQLTDEELEQINAGETQPQGPLGPGNAPVEIGWGEDRRLL